MKYMMLTQFNLYSTLGCHLCEDALAVLEDLHGQMLKLAEGSNFEVKGNQLFLVKQIDIADDDQLITTLGQRIPVLVSPAGRELDWPFDIQQVYQFILPELNLYN